MFADDQNGVTDEFDDFIDNLICENPDIPFREGDMELISELLPELGRLPDFQPMDGIAFGSAAAASSTLPPPSEADPQQRPPEAGSQQQASSSAGSQQGYGVGDISDAASHHNPYATSKPTSHATDAHDRNGGSTLPTAHSHEFTGLWSVPQPAGGPQEAAPPMPLQVGGMGPQAMRMGSCTDLEGLSRKGKGKKSSSAASQAQKKYMDRQKMKMAHSEKQVAELTRALEVLMREKKELEVKERIMRDSLNGITIHMDHLFADKVVREFQQLSLIQKKAELQSRVEGRQIPMEEARSWTMQDFICVHFQRYLQRLAELLPEASQNPYSPAAQEVDRLVRLHNENDKPGAVASCFHWALLCWNVEEAEKRKSQGPDWRSILAEMRITEEQREKLVTARRHLLRRMREIVGARRSILAQLGLDLISAPREEVHKCPAAMELYNSFKHEQTAVLGFLINTDAALSSLQEAILDVRAAPWCPAMIKLTDLLAGSGAEAESDIRGLRPEGPLAVMPFATPYEVLTMPLCGMGVGKNLRFGVVMCPSWTVLSYKCCPHVGQDILRRHSLLSVCCGRWRRYTSWEWLVQVRQKGTLLENPLVDDTSDVNER